MWSCHDVPAGVEGRVLVAYIWCRIQISNAKERVNARSRRQKGYLLQFGAKEVDGEFVPCNLRTGDYLQSNQYSEYLLGASDICGKPKADLRVPPYE